MKKLFLILLTTLLMAKAFSQDNERLFVNAPNGLIIRDKPNSNAQRIGKLPYGSFVTVLENTEIMQQLVDQGAKVEGVWLGVRYDNYPFIVNESTSGSDSDKGYVFSGYLEELEKASVEITPIDSLQFYDHLKVDKRDKPFVIESQAETEKLLATRVKWKHFEFDSYSRYFIDQIILDNGQTLRINQAFIDLAYDAYYPKEQVILFEGGHSGEYSISLKTGETTATTGNPDFIIESPNKKTRLNGWWSGHECNNYFFQQRAGDQLRYLVDFGRGSNDYAEELCYFKQFSWLNDYEFIYSIPEAHSVDEAEKYFKGIIILK